ncbi:hypothetical protein M8C21_014788 [Ambrosia artemisiifolia]|uniref:Alpha-carbonic anhydrase domain-containing protein n=1 Tax=Ambrosia artemisiifolia TaxID=4212 RepID=A0AAD5G2U5_AMBAR|nr:hypothetical protein M8C21_014788 [Ambrosia artemisiifolia]
MISVSMSNPNILSLIIVYLMITSLQSFILICKADASNETETGLHHRRWRASKIDTPNTTSVDSPRKTSNKPPLKGTQPISKGTPTGPEKWGSLNPDWKTCSAGKSQSPISIDVKGAQVKPDNLKQAYIDAPARLINGHDNIAIEWLGDAGGIVLTEKIKTLGTKEAIDLGKINASSLRHDSKRHYRYIGSLTAPPCTEGVIWTIEEKVRSVSQDQINLLKGPHQRELKQNARPLQQLGGRPIWIFDLPIEK